MNQIGIGQGTTGKIRMMLNGDVWNGGTILAAACILGVVALFFAYRGIGKYYMNHFVMSYQGREESRAYQERLERVRKFLVFQEERWVLTMQLIWSHYLAGEFDLALSEAEKIGMLKVNPLCERRLVLTKLDGGKHVFTGTADEMMKEILEEIYIEKELRNI